MRLFETSIIAIALLLPFLLFSFLRSKALGSKETVFQYVLRAAMPLLAFITLVIVNVAVAVLFSLQHVPEKGQTLPMLAGNAICVSVVLWLSVDNIRCKSKANRVLGVAYLALCIGFAIWVVAEALGELAT